MTMAALVLLALATGIFIAAATTAKAWALSPGLGLLVLTLALYSTGNLVMLRLIRRLGMATAFSLSAVFQLVAVSLVGVLVYGERMSILQGAGVVLAIVATVLISFAPAMP
ncbi:hypothetical protein P7D22_04155 [Lichenihabitans sp. Uapishka_5]|uniref:hypothetical protein n=1 Tax=Lichenihabitans sp. Uapishka_5 TaxID=3037302 RepID=UPI0029E7CEB1|nr:hypothetical protein [Lichenihabitans sp. Uapishka_5]MDX7950370.1 hypothetical protein [Lichenihabitans sp. Uapishka_5]